MPIISLTQPRATLRLFGMTCSSRRGALWCASPARPPPLPVRMRVPQVVAELSGSTRVAVDSSGPALVAAPAAGPALIKPNREELAEAAGAEIRSLRDAVAAAHELRSRGARAVLVSLGADGALLVDADGAVHGEARAVPRSTVGAGDALLAGFLAAHDNPLAEALAWGAAAVSLPGSRMPGPDDIDRTAVRLHDSPDLDRVLGGV